MVKNYHELILKNNQYLAIRLSARVFLNRTLRLVWLSLIGLVSLIKWFVLTVLILPVHLATLPTLLVHLIVLVFLVLLIHLVILTSLIHLVVLILLLLIVLILALVIAGCLLIVLTLVVHIRLVLLVLIIHAGLVVHARLIIHTGLVLLVHLVILVLLILLGSLTFAISLRVVAYIVTHTIIRLITHSAPTLTINDYRKFGTSNIAVINKLRCFKTISFNSINAALGDYK